MDPFTERLAKPPPRFVPPTPVRATLSSGVPVLVLEDHDLPLVNIHLEITHGYCQAPPELFAAAVGLDELMRTGGTASRSPAQVDLDVETRALTLDLEVGARFSTAGLNLLPRHLEEGLALMGEVLRAPAFDAAIVDGWVGKQVEALRRRNDRPGPIAQRWFNRLMYGDHPLGRTLEREDLDGLDGAALRRAHRMLIRPEGMVIGVSGDVDVDRVVRLLDGLLEGWTGGEERPGVLEPPVFAERPGLFVVDRPLAQASLVVGQPGRITVGDHRDYFVSRVLNFILGGSGFTSRLTREMRTVRGYAYSARTNWNAAVDGERPLTAVTETRSENTAPALSLIRDIFQGMVDAPPEADELQLARENIRHGFLFEFELPSQIVNRQASYLARGLPLDWFECYLEGVDRTTSAEVHDLAQRVLSPAGLTAVVVGDRSRMGPDLERWAALHELPLELGTGAWEG